MATFIEVYNIPLREWDDPTCAEDNKRLINVDNIANVKHSNKCENRAEIRYCCGKEITVIGSYDQIVNRIQAAVGGPQVVRTDVLEK